MSTTRTKMSVRAERAHCSLNRPMCLAAAVLAGASGLIASPASADVHDWTGNVNTSFHNAGNWNIGQVPAAGDSVIILGGSNNVLLFADTPDLSSLYIGGNRDFFNMGHDIDVTGGFNTTTVSGQFSELVLSNGPSNVELWTSDLTLQNEGSLVLQGAWAVIDDQFLMTGNSKISGFGVIETTSVSASSMNGVDGESLTVSGGDLMIRNLFGGGIALPDNVNILQGLELDLQAPLSSDLQNVYMEAGSSFESDEDRTLAGQLTAQTSGGAAATIHGDSAFFVEGEVQVGSNSHLIFDDPMNLESTGQLTIGVGATLELDTWSNSDAGSTATVGLGGLLKFDGPLNAGGWNGNITTTAATIEVNSFTNLQMHGTLNLGNLLSTRSSINGTSIVRIHDEAVSNAGPIVNGSFEITQTGQLTLGPTAVMDINGDLLLRNGSNTIGGGNIGVNGGGEMTVVETAYVGADVFNGGTLRPGTFDNVDYIYIDGEYEQYASGRLAIQMGGPANADRDIVETSGQAWLSGELNIELVDGFVPVIGQTYDVMWVNGGANGAFDSVTGEPGFSVNYGANTISVTYDGVPSCPADTNGDFMVDIIDLLAVLANWGACDEACPADTDDSGVVDILDLLMVLGAWGACV